MKRAAAVLFALLAGPAPAAGPSDVRIGALGALYSLDNDTPDWKEYTLFGAARWPQGQAVSLEVLNVERFGLNDTQAALTYRRAYGKAWAVELEAGGGSPHEILPAYLGALRVERRAGPVTLGAGWRRTHYDDADVQLVTATAGLELAHAYAGYTLYHGQLKDGGSGTSHLVQAGVLYGERSRVGVGYATGDEASRVAPGVVTVTDITTLFLGGQHWLGPHWGILYGVERHEQGALYTREGGRLGLVHRF